MLEKWELEDSADELIADVQDYIDVEGQFVTRAHELHEKMLAWEHVISQFWMELPDDTDMKSLAEAVMDKFSEITNYLQENELDEMRIIKEEEHLTQQLHVDIGHRDWRAVRRDITTEQKDEKKALRLEKRELAKLHGMFRRFLRIMDIISRAFKAGLPEHLRQRVTGTALPDEGDKEKYRKAGKLAEYYYMQIFKLVRAYEHALGDLLVKELKLFKDIRHNGRKVKK